MCFVWIDTENKTWDEYVKDYSKKRETETRGQAVQAQGQTIPSGTK